MPNAHGPGFNLLGPVINIVTIIMGVVTAYFVTIQSLKIDLAAKAERAVVETLDKRLTAFEVSLTEGAVTRDQFCEFARDTEARLARIELYLAQQSEDERGNK